MDEKTFWRSTPRKIFALMDIHVEMNTTPEQRAEKGIKTKRDTPKNNKEVVNQIASW